MKQCWGCQGLGWVSRNWYNRGQDLIAAGTEECEVCQGKGQLPDTESVAVVCRGETAVDIPTFTRSN